MALSWASFPSCVVLVLYLCSAPFIATLLFPLSEHIPAWCMHLSTEACDWCTVATVPCCAVPKVCAQLGWLEADHEDEWDVFWSDQSISLARAVAMQPMQVLSVQSAGYRCMCLDLAACVQCNVALIRTFGMIVSHAESFFHKRMWPCTGCRKSTILLACWSYAGRKRLHATYQQWRHNSQDTLSSAPRHMCCQRTYHPCGGT